MDSKESITPAYVAWRAGANPIPSRIFLAPVDCSKILALCTYILAWN
jgi:hypothetical protein